MYNELIPGLLTVGIYFFIRYLNSTDVPRIKGLLEVPSVPIFGNIFQLGSYHHVAAQKPAKKYGPVFQVRMGNMMSIAIFSPAGEMLLIGPQTACRFCEYFRIRQRHLDQLADRHDVSPTLYAFHKITSSDGKAVFNSESITVDTLPGIRRARTGSRLSLPL